MQAGSDLTILQQIRGRLLFWEDGKLAKECETNEVLVQEYFQLQKIVEDFDRKALTIKAWSVTLSAAAIVAAYVEDAPTVLLVASGSALVFWLIEAVWKVNQQAFYKRIRQIENHFNGTYELSSPLQIATAWSAAWRERGRDRFALRVMWWSHVALPHIVVAMAGLILFFIAPPATP